MSKARAPRVSVLCTALLFCVIGRDACAQTADPALLEKYRTSAPRYTSYPTAVDWDGGEFDPLGYPDRLARASERYVHQV